MSLLGDLLGWPADGGARQAENDCGGLDLQREIETEAVFEHFTASIMWLAAEISRQSPVSYDDAYALLSIMPDEHMRELAHPFGTMWLAHNTAKALGLADAPPLKITVH